MAFECRPTGISFNFFVNKNCNKVSVLTYTQFGDLRSRLAGHSLFRTVCSCGCEGMPVGQQLESVRSSLPVDCLDTLLELLVYQK